MLQKWNSRVFQTGPCRGLASEGNMRMTSDFALMGRFDVDVDDGGSTSIPFEWYDEMGKPRVVYLVSDAHERCLDLIPKELFDEYVSSSIADVEEAAIRDRVRREARLVKVDDSGQINIDMNLRVFAGINDCVAMVGSVRLIKLYNPDMLATGNEISSADLERMLDVFEGS